MTGESPNELTAHLTTSAMVVYGLETMKSQGWFPWITCDSKTMNRVVSAVLAAAVAFGISATGDMNTGWTIHIPMASALLPAIWDWAKQYSLQQVIYDGVVQKAGSKGSSDESSDHSYPAASAAVLAESDESRQRVVSPR